MAGISFNDNSNCDWLVAGWAFRQALRDLRDDMDAEAALTEMITAAEHQGLLDLQLLEIPDRAKISQVIEKMCLGILDGTRPSSIGKMFPDEETRQIYQEGIVLLLSVVQTARRLEP